MQSRAKGKVEFLTFKRDIVMTASGMCVSIELA